MLLGCIADDFTGATDLANTLVKAGMPTVQTIGVPDGDLDLGDAQAAVVALKSRTVPVADAVRQSLDALGWLKARGARQIVFKYCSTFDSTETGNIGPVAEALSAALGTDFTIYCPAFPGAGRSIYKGYLFVGDGLLSESGMQDHPLTPMTDPNLMRVLTPQVTGKVGLVAYDIVRQGTAAVRARFDALRGEGVRHAIVDALTEKHLMDIGAACDGLQLVTGGSGIAMGLPANVGIAGRTKPSLPPVAGKAAVLAGSCSRATRGQVAYAKARWPSHEIDALRIAHGKDVAGEALAWAAEQGGDTPVLIYSSADPETIAEIQDALGRDRAGHLVEGVMGRIALGLGAMGVRRLVVAGGETSGAVVQALGVKALRIGPEIDPGVPWTVALGTEPMVLALKSGNFGAEDFFDKAFAMLG